MAVLLGAGVGTAPGYWLALLGAVTLAAGPATKGQTQTGEAEEVKEEGRSRQGWDCMATSVVEGVCKGGAKRVGVWGRCVAGGTGTCNHKDRCCPSGSPFCHPAGNFRFLQLCARCAGSS